MATTTAPTKSASQANRHRHHVAVGGRHLRFEDLSADAVYQAKRFLLDSIGCALGGYQQHDVTIALEVLDEIAGPGQGDGHRHRQADGCGIGVAGQRADDPLHGLQRHLLEAGPVASLRHLSGRAWPAASAPAVTAAS